MKKLILVFVLFFVFKEYSFSQYNPVPAAAFTWNGSSWAAAASSGVSGPIGYQPSPIALYCFNSSLAQWVRADSSCFGGGGGSGTVTSFSSGNLSPLFTTSVATPTTTPALSFTLSTASANTAFGNFTGSTAAPSFTATTGTGSPVAATSPTLVTPALGTPSALVITNATGTCTACTANVAGSVTNALTLNNSNSGAASGSTYNGSAAVTLSANTLGAGSLANANTWSGANTISTAGAASAAPLEFTGALFTGGTGTTTFPMLMLQPSGATAETGWNTSGTFLGINSASGFAGYFADFHLNNASTLFRVDSLGNVVISGVFQSSTFAAVGNTAANAFRAANNGVFGWSSTSAFSGGNDTTLCRSSAGVVEVGSAAGCATSGSISATGIIGGSFQQQAASNTGGTCAMSTGTSCTITIGHSYTTPVCIATQQSATLTGGAVGCTVSGTTVTITSAVANSETWGAFVFGNPN